MEPRYIDAIALIQQHGDDVTNWDKPYAVKISSIEKFPTVSLTDIIPEAEWIYEGEDRGYKCSNCGGWCLLNYESDYHKSTCCPHCGFRMKNGL